MDITPSPIFTAPESHCSWRQFELANHVPARKFPGMSTVVEIESALKQLPLQDAQAIAQWLQKYLDLHHSTQPPSASQTSIKLPDYAARRKIIFGEKTLPNMVLLSREEERW